MKLGIFADTHVGRCIPRAIGELRRRAYRHSFTQAINIFIDEGVDCLVHAGDVFEKRSMTPEDSVFVKEELQRLADSIGENQGKDVTILAIRGNHDGAPESNALDYIKHPLAKYLKVIGDEILRGKEEVQIRNGIGFVGVAYHPYIARRFEDLKPILKRSLAAGSELRLLVVHNFVHGYHPIPPGVPEHNFLSATDFDDLGADVVVAGHYHAKLEPVERDGTVLLTPGATEAVDLSDQGPHGVYILEGERSVRFVPIEPLHDIRNVRMTSEGAVKPAKWFVDMALEEIRAYASSLQEIGVDGVLRLVLVGLTDEDPYSIEPPAISELAKIKETARRLLHVELVNRVENVRQPLALPALGGGVEFAAEILSRLGTSTQDATKMVEEVGIALDEKASQRTGLLTGLDRARFVSRWAEILERAEALA